MNKLIASMQSNLFKLEQKEYEQLSLQSKNEAVEIALQLAQHPAPPMPVFNLDQKYYDAGTLADAIDDVFGRDGELKTSYEQSFESQQGSEGMDAEAPLTDAEATEICTDWKKQYNVVVGVSWGDLPYDLQQKWLHYSCDYHMQDEVV